MLNLNYKTQRLIILSTFLTIPLILLATFTFYPALRLIQLSFTDWDGISQSYKWIGIANYKEIFSNKDIFGVFSHNVYYFIGGIIQNILALYFAIILNTKIKGRNIFRAFLFLPYILNSVATAYMFQFIFNTDHGTLNTLLDVVGLGAYKQSWLGNTDLVNISLASVSLWKFMGFNMVIYLGVLQSIPGDLYEAAKIDGANSWKTLIYITLPNIRKIIELNMLLTVSGALEVFDIPYVITGAAAGSDTFVTKVNDVAFRFNNIGLASAMAIVLLIIVTVVITVQRKFILRGEE
ncbi:carbohydrate ABC transporter permease [Paenibacillus sp. SI8]|uniref:carbohydrate ABC transporter permease n=1 Tax=unclassified Paenibacillus TaxID=185978 RepID=UPI003465D385